MIKKITFLLVIALMMFPFLGKASNVVIVNLNQVSMETYFYPLTFDNLALDFSVVPAQSDVLQTLVIKNYGSARFNYEIEKLVLWSSAGSDFMGFAVDTKLGEATYDSGNQVWVFKSLNATVPLSGKRFFVTAETKKNGSDSKTFQFLMPAYSDVDADGVYDMGDTGMFFESKTILPESGLLNIDFATYKATTHDSSGPVTVITNLKNGQTITNSTDFTITGESRDQGGSNPDTLEVCIDGGCASATNTSSYFLKWKYDWTDISDGSHSIYTKTKDSNNNLTTSATMTVTKTTVQVVSTANSIVSLNKSAAKADGSDSILVTAIIKDSNKQAMQGKTVYFSEFTAGGVGVVDSEKVTDASGQVVFSVKSSAVGTFRVSIIVEGGSIIDDNIQIQFIKAASEAISYTDGEFIKLADQKAVYFLDKKNIRHAYPSQAIWESYWGNDFSFVKIVSADAMAGYSLGVNVPFKAGILMKIPSVAKVYKVEANGVIHWIKTEATAKSLYGNGWAALVKDLSEAFFTDYTVGADID